MAKVECFTETDPKDAVILFAFPSAGSAAPIAAQYLLRHLDLPLVGHVQVPELLGLASIHEGRVTSPVVLHGGQVVCKLGKDCPRLYVATCDVPLPGQVMVQIIQALLKWSTPGHLILALESVVRAPDDDTPDVYVAAASPEVLAELTKQKIKPMPRAMIAGTTAQVLLAGQDAGLRTAGLIVEADPEQPDGRAAAELLKVLDKLVPDIDLDANPLMEEAMELEKAIQDAQAAAARQGAATGPTFI